MNRLLLLALFCLAVALNVVAQQAPIGAVNRSTADLIVNWRIR